MLPPVKEESSLQERPLVLGEVPIMPSLLNNRWVYMYLLDNSKEQYFEIGICWELSIIVLYTFHQSMKNMKFWILNGHIMYIVQLKGHPSPVFYPGGQNFCFIFRCFSDSKATVVLIL